MRTHLTGGPAFPAHAQCGDDTGMTLRDYFAAKAMHQFLAGSILPDGYDAAEEFANLAIRAYEMADHMILERSK